MACRPLELVRVGGGVEATVGLVDKAGGTVVMQPFDVMDAGRMAIIQDPTGAIIAVWQAKNQHGARS